MDAVDAVHGKRGSADSGSSGSVTLEDLQRQVADLAKTPLAPVEEAEKEGPNESSVSSGMDAKEWTFQFSHTTARGEVFAGTFTNRILTVGEQQGVAVVAARLAGGVPYEALSQQVQALNQAIAHMSVSFTSSDGKFRGPAWAEDLRGLMDADVVLSLWSRVVAHETRFFRLDAPAEEG